MAEESLTAKAKSAIKNATGKDVDEILEAIEAPKKDGRAESLKARAKSSLGGGGARGGSGSLGGGAGATGADLLHQMNPQKLIKKGGVVRNNKRRAGIDTLAVRKAMRSA